MWGCNTGIVGIDVNTIGLCKWRIYLVVAISDSSWYLYCLTISVSKVWGLLGVVCLLRERKRVPKCGRICTRILLKQCVQNGTLCIGMSRYIVKNTKNCIACFVLTRDYQNGVRPVWLCAVNMVNTLFLFLKFNISPICNRLHLSERYTCHQADIMFISYHSSDQANISCGYLYVELI